MFLCLTYARLLLFALDQGTFQERGARCPIHHNMGLLECCYLADRGRKR